MKKILLIFSCSTIFFSCLPAKAQEPVFNLKDFKSLKWLEGKWQGAAEGEASFYEQYIFLNDSTMAMLYFKDASFAGVPDTAFVFLKMNDILHRSGKALWKAKSVAPDEIVFLPVNTRNSFTWRKETQDQWQAILEWTDKEGKQVIKKYTIKRVGI